MNRTEDADTAFDPTMLALVGVAVALGVAGYMLVPEYGNAVYYALMTIGIVSLGGLIAKNRR